MTDIWLRDLRLAARGLLRKPAFCLLAVTTLTLGIGANSAIFSIVNGLLLRPFPYEQPDQLVTLWSTWPEKGVERGSLSWPDFEVLGEQDRIFQHLAAFHLKDVNLMVDGVPSRLSAGAVSDEFFDTLGVAPSRGRSFEGSAGGGRSGHEVLISESLWRRNYGSRQDILGLRADIDGTPHTVVGVIPDRLDLPQGAQLWLPLSMQDRQAGSHASFLSLIARRSPEVSLEQVQAELPRWTEKLRASQPEGWPEERYLSALDLRTLRVGDMRTVLLILMGMVGFILLIACVNVANLLIARHEDQRREIAISMALGAQRRQIVRRLLWEMGLLAAAGGLGGLLVGSWGVSKLPGLLPVELPAWLSFSLDLKVLAATAGAALTTVLLAGLGPALRAASGGVEQGLRETGNATTIGGKGRKALVVVEIALSLVLLVGAGLMTRSFWQLRQVDPGFATEHTLAFEVDLFGGRPSSADDRLQRVDAIVERLRALPGVESAAAAGGLPLSFSAQSTNFTVLGQTADQAQGNPHPILKRVGDDYFATLGIPVTAGTGELRYGHTVVVNEAFRQRVWPSKPPLGAQLRRGGPDSSEPWLELVGVVGDVLDFGLDKESQPTLYLPIRSEVPQQVSFVVRTHGSPEGWVASIRRAVDEAAPGEAAHEVLALSELTDKALWRWRILTYLFATFAVIALVLAAGGLYGVVSYTVARQTKEIGIRMALGSSSTHVLTMVLRQALGLTAVGLCIGLPLALGMSKAMESLIFGIGFADPWTYGLLMGALLLVSLVAGVVPARRATKVDPNRALRAET